MNYGVGEPEKKMLFEYLGPLTAEMGTMRDPKGSLTSVHEQAERKELEKANMIARVLDLRNANAGGIAYENRRRVIAAFSPPGKPGDSGRPEVQGMGDSYLLNVSTHLFLSCHSYNANPHTVGPSPATEIRSGQPSQTRKNGTSSSQDIEVSQST